MYFFVLQCVQFLTFNTKKKQRPRTVGLPYSSIMIAKLSLLIAVMLVYRVVADINLFEDVFLVDGICCMSLRCSFFFPAKGTEQKYSRLKPCLSAH